MEDKDQKQYTAREVAIAILDKAKTLTKDALEKSELIKDDMPHPPQSPQDEAHDVMEENEALKTALALLDTPEKQKAMLEHLRMLSDPNNLRSPENQEIGHDSNNPMAKMTPENMNTAQINEVKVPQPKTPQANEKVIAKQPLALQKFMDQMSTKGK